MPAIVQRTTLAIASLALLGLAGLPAEAANKADQYAALTAALIKSYDADKDGTLDLAEIKQAAEAYFDHLEKDKDGTLDKKEIKGLGIDLKSADPDKDGTLDKPEYLRIVEQRFQAADADRDGKLSAKELKTSAGRKLLRLLK